MVIHFDKTFWNIAKICKNRKEGINTAHNYYTIQKIFLKNLCRVIKSRKFFDTCGDVDMIKKLHTEFSEIIFKKLNEWKGVDGEEFHVNLIDAFWLYCIVS